jgi:hypothetical protein
MTNNKQQTAVEWLKKQLEDYGSTSHLILDWDTFDELCEQAKEMEKEHIKIAWNHGFDWGMMEQSLADQGEPSTLIDANHFYNETYGGNK